MHRFLSQFCRTPEVTRDDPALPACYLRADRCVLLLCNRTQQLEDVHQLTWRRGCTAFLCVAIPSSPRAGGCGCLMLGFTGNDVAGAMQGCVSLQGPAP